MPDDIKNDLETLRNWALARRDKWSSGAFWINFSRAVGNLSRKYNEIYAKEISEIHDYIESLAYDDGAIT